MNMFPADVYIQRRQQLKEDLKSGILLFFGNDESPINYPDNHYAFRQDSTFLYFWGLDLPGLTAIIDIDDNRETVFGHDGTLDNLIFAGPQPSLNELCLQSGVTKCASADQLETILKSVLERGRKVHFLPQYRPANVLKIHLLLDIDVTMVNHNASPALIKAVVAQRAVKADAEIHQIEAALDIASDMHAMAMKMSKAGTYEKEVVGAMAGLAYSRDGSMLAYPVIFTINGHILHNPYHGNKMRKGDLVINDSGVESTLHYASDITRTFPVSGKFTRKQTDIYSIVLEAQKTAIEYIRPGIEYREVHCITAKTLASGLKSLGLMQGNIDDAVSVGAHALFFPHGLGHMLGLDVHDMEDLGEDYVGYSQKIKRSDQFGTSYLRLARALDPGFVVTVEPGLYFIPALIDRWKAAKKFVDFINYDKLEGYRHFGGVRIEDDVLVLKDGCRVLGQPIPKTIEEVEALSS
ncbi:MAG: aminopeptidase P family protein [Desulfobacterales bacterium]|jgi:Xaa-Pro aminopeptidase